MMMGTFNIVSLLIVTFLFTYSKGQLKPFICSECAKQFANFEAYKIHFGKVAPDKHHTHSDYWNRDPMKHLHLWHPEHISASSSSHHHHQQDHVLLFFNPPTPAQRELYFKTYGAEAEEDKKNMAEWKFDYFQWGKMFKYYPNKPNKFIPGKIHEIYGDGNCLFSAISYVMMGTVGLHYLIRARTDGWNLDLDAIDTKYGEYTDIIKAAHAYKVNIIAYFEKKNIIKGDWLYFGPESKDEVGQQASYNPAHPTIPLVLTGETNNHYNVILELTELNIN